MVTDVATMNPTAAAAAAVPAGSPLEIAVALVEQRLVALGAALARHDSASIERQAHALHLALAAAVDGFVGAAREGAIPAALRQRLVLTGGLVAAQRESLARATSALDRAIDVLMPREGAGLCSASGPADRARCGASISA